MPTRPVLLSEPEVIAHSLIAPNWFGLIALAAGFQMTRGRYAEAGKVLMVVCLGLTLAEALRYVLGVRGLR